MATELSSREIAPRIRILIVDEQEVMCEGLRMLLERNPCMLVVGQAGSCDEALAATVREKPDIVLLELEVGGSSTLRFIRELIERGGGARVIVLTGVRDREAHRQAVRLGAMGLVLKTSGCGVLIKAIERVHAGEAWLDHRMTAAMIAEISRPRRVHDEAVKIASLTEREREIITAVGQGLKSRQIAERLFISETTVRNHLTSILGKLGLSDRFELAIYSYRYGLAIPPVPQPVE